MASDLIKCIKNAIDDVEFSLGECSDREMCALEGKLDAYKEDYNISILDNFEETHYNAICSLLDRLGIRYIEKSQEEEIVLQCKVPNNLVDIVNDLSDKNYWIADRVH